MAPPSDPSSSLSVGVARDGGQLSYVQIVFKAASVSTFKLPMQYPKDIDGEPRFVFTDPEMSKVAEEFHFAFVLKFVHLHPTIDDVCLAIIRSWGLLEILTVMSVMDDFHVLVQLKSERDFIPGWVREGRIIAACVYRLFRWTKEFDLKKESSLAPQWLYLPGLPMHMYRSDCL